MPARWEGLTIRNVVANRRTQFRPGASRDRSYRVGSSLEAKRAPYSLSIPLSNRTD